MSDTLYVRPGAVFFPDLDGAPTGLVGELAVTIIRKSDGVAVAARSVEEIVEAPADSGHYQATRTAPPEAGEFRIEWDRGGGPAEAAFDDLVVTYDLPVESGPGADWAPTVADVAALIRARTKIPGGGEVGTFNDNTRPTKAEVELLIAQAVDHVKATIGGDPCNDQLKESAGACACLLTAVLIEASYWPEQSEARGSTAARLESLYDKRIKTLASAVAEECGGQGTGGGEDGNAGAVAAGSFSDGLPLIGRDYPPRW